MDPTQAVKFITTVKNRDAALRFLQFGNRVILNVLANTSGLKAVRAGLTTTTAALVSGRKLFAFGNEVSEALNATNLAKAAIAAPTCDTVLPLVRSVAMTNFWMLDHVLFLSQFAKVIKADPKWHTVAANRVWLVAVLCSIYLDTKAYQAAMAAATAEGKSSDDKLVERSKAKTIVVRQVRNACDLLVATVNSDFVACNPVIVNVAGALSAALFMWEFF